MSEKKLERSEGPEFSMIELLLQKKDSVEFSDLGTEEEESDSSSVPTIRPERKITRARNGSSSSSITES